MNAEINFNAPIPSVAVDAMIAARAGAIAKIEAAADLLNEACSLIAAGHLGAPGIGYCEGGRSTYVYARGADIVAKATRAIDRGGWQYLMNQSGLLTFMDSKARAEWNAALHDSDGKFPPLTMENVIATFRAMHDSRGEMFERGVIECFRSLSWDYRTNNPCRFGKRIITTGFCGVWNKRASYPNSNATNRADDLIRVFSVVDGKPEPDHRDGIYRHVRTAMDAGGSSCSTEYINMKWFNNGNAHIKFNRLDLVEELNKIIAKHYPGALPPRVD